jgi:hypothetical protein
MICTNLAISFQQSNTDGESVLGASIDPLVFALHGMKRSKT